MVHLRVKNLSKCFDLDRKRHGKIIPGGRKHTVLKKVSFEIRKGESVGIVGRNGSGKTTLLKLIAGILEPDEGIIETEGRILPLIDLQTGMIDELTGRENIFQKGIIHGLTRKEVHTKLSRIIMFSGLKEFIDIKLKKYSTGMRMRLAFSIAMEIPHDILLLDEIAGVGDADFQKKSRGRLNELKLEGKTFVVVSHQMQGFVEECDRVIFLDEGKIVADGPPDETIQLYLGYMVKHHLADMKEEIKRRLEEFERLKPSARVSQKEEEGAVKRAIGGIFKWGMGKKVPEQTYEGIRVDLKLQVREFEHLVSDRREYLTQELSRLQDLLYKQKECNKSHAPDFEAEQKCLSDISEREDEFRQLLDGHEFLLDVKIRLGYKSHLLGCEHRAVKGTIKSLIETESAKTGKRALKERYLKVLGQELAENPPMKEVLLIIRDYASTCQEILKSESDGKARVEVLERFLNLIEARFNEGTQKELWVVERLIEETGSVFEPDVLLLTEFPFLLRYITMAGQALITVASQSAVKKKTDVLGHLLRETIHSAERELLNLSLLQEQMSSKELKKQARLSDAKSQLLNSLSELYTPFRTRPIQAGEGWGFGDAEITGISLHVRNGEESQVFKTGEPMRVVIRYVLRKQLAKGILIGLTIHHENGLPLFTPNTIITEEEKLEPGVENTVQFSLKSLPLTSGRYPLSVAIYDPLVTVPYDHRHQASEFMVVGEEGLGNQGILDLEHSWEIGPQSPVDMKLSFQVK